MRDSGRRGHCRGLRLPLRTLAQRLRDAGLQPFECRTVDVPGPALRKSADELSRVLLERLPLERNTPGDLAINIDVSSPLSKVNDAAYAPTMQVGPELRTIGTRTRGNVGPYQLDLPATHRLAKELRRQRRQIALIGELETLVWRSNWGERRAPPAAAAAA